MPQQTAPTTTIALGHWTVNLDTGHIQDSEREFWLEPTPLLLLKALAENPGEVITKEVLIAKVWPDRTVGDDALAQAVFRLRKSLSDHPAAPEYVENVPRKGYRLSLAIHPPSQSSEPADRSRRGLWLAPLLLLVLVALALWWFITAQTEATDTNPAAPATITAANLTSQADDFYSQYTRSDNEAAIELYQRAIATAPDYAASQSGLANALVQKVLRWPNAVNEAPIEHDNLLQAIRAGRTTTEAAQATLQRAEQLAQRAVRLDPNNAVNRRALGFAYASQAKFDQALIEYQAAIQLNPDAWGAMINLSEIYQAKDQPEQSLKTLEQAFNAMTRVYEQQKVKVRPWLPGIGNLIGERHRELANHDEAEIWFRHVLSIDPYHQAATENLVRLLLESGDNSAAQSICHNYQTKIGQLSACSELN